MLFFIKNCFATKKILTMYKCTYIKLVISLAIKRPYCSDFCYKTGVF
jgi:hypothetical protein